MHSVSPQRELADDDIEKMLAGGPVAAPCAFRGRTLAPYSAGLRDLIMKIVRANDTGVFHDVAVVHVLGRAHGLTDEARRANRLALIVATENVPEFRAALSLEMDDLQDAEIDEIRALVDGILAPPKAAQVQVMPEIGAKKNVAGRGKRSRTKTRS